MSEREEFEEYYKSEGWAPDDVDWKAWQAARRTVSGQEALKEAAKVCDAVSIDFAQRLKSSDNPTYLEGKADGAQDCAIALLRLADAEKDAARYRWILENADVLFKRAEFFNGIYSHYPATHEVSEAIDAAILAANGGKK